MTAAAARLYEQHRDLLARATAACATREYFSPFPETPDRYPDSAAALARGLDAFRAQLGRPFELQQPGEYGRLGAEVSPYTGEPLGIDYPRADIDVLFGAARAAVPAWTDAGPRGARRRVPRDRAGVVRGTAGTGARRHAHRRPEPGHELRRQRHQRARPRHRGDRLRAPGHVGRAAAGAVGTALRLGHHPAAEALPAGAAGRRRVLHLRDVPHLERLSGDAGEPRHRQRSDRQAAPDRDPANGIVRARGTARAGRGGLRPQPRDPGRRQPGRAARQAAGRASAHRDRGLHRQRAVRRVGGASCAPCPLLHRDLGREHRAARVGARPGRGSAQPRHHDAAVFRADVHLAAEHLPAARRHRRRRTTRQRRRSLRLRSRRRSAA